MSCSTGSGGTVANATGSFTAGSWTGGTGTGAAGAPTVGGATDCPVAGIVGDGTGGTTVIVVLGEDGLACGSAWTVRAGAAGCARMITVAAATAPTWAQLCASSLSQRPDSQTISATARR